jgi:hypothetical protein
MGSNARRVVKDYRAAAPNGASTAGSWLRTYRFEAGFFLVVFLGVSPLLTPWTDFAAGGLVCNFSSAARDMVGILGIVYPEAVS